MDARSGEALILNVCAPVDGVVEIVVVAAVVVPIASSSSQLVGSGLQLTPFTSKLSSGQKPKEEDNDVNLVEHLCSMQILGKSARPEK